MRLVKNIITYILFIFSIFFVSNSYYYEPNADIKNYLDDITESFTKISSYSHLWTNNIPTAVFTNIENSFSVLKDKLPQIPRFKVIYENCYLASQSLASGFEKAKLDTFNAQCFWPWKNISSQINTKYAIQANITAYPTHWNAPLTVTFDGRSSKDPSSDTIPTNNYYWYYKDGNWVTKLMGQWPLIKYTFTNPNNYIVHLTVRSSNRNTEWILDWFASTSISVAPPIAHLSLYINWQRSYKSSYVKISSKEWKNWVFFDASWTTPEWSTKITSSYWKIRKWSKIIYERKIPDYPWSVKVKLNEDGIYFVTVWIKDNTWKQVEWTYKLIVSNPVALIRVSPTNWNTSSKFTIDWSLSYSVNWRINSYKWTIVWPDGSKIDSFEDKKSFTYDFHTPWNYAITLLVEDINWDKNNETYKLNVESTPPVANFVYKKYDNWLKPSTFIFDASYSIDVDEKYWDKLSYLWSFSNSKFVKTQSINNWEKLIAQFDKIWVYKVNLIVKDKYWKTSTITKTIKVKSTLRPKVSINPNYTIIWKPISIKVDTHKSVAYYEYFYWDRINAKTQAHLIEHTYSKAWVYTLKVNVSSTDWDSNSITKKVFVWQRWYPLAIYDIYKWDKQQLASTYCKISKASWNWYSFTPAYKIARMKYFTLNASKSINWKWTNDMLSIYFRKDNSSENILKSNLNVKFDELWCRKIELYVRDLNTNKLDKKSIYFKVVNDKPTLKGLSMFFPQYWGNQWTNTFTPQIWNSSNPKNLFKKGFDPLLVKLIVRWAIDPDSPVIAYYKWYYYREWDDWNLIDVKETPYNINQSVFSLPKIPWKYIFWVDVYDVDGAYTDSEKYLKQKLVVDIPPSNSNPDIPQVNSVRIDNWTKKWIWEVNVWDPLTISINSQVLSNKSDFYSSRTIKYDFNNDWEYDLTTKKDTVKYTFTKPWKYRVKVKVIYRWYGWIGYSSQIIVKKWLKPMIDINHKWKMLIYNDLSFWNIKKKNFCFSIRQCKINPADFMVRNWTYWVIKYQTIWTKLVIFDIKDTYGNEKTLRKKVNIDHSIKEGYLLTLPEYTQTGNNYHITTAWMYKNYIIFYYDSKNKNCYIDKNISVDSDNNGSTTDDNNISCNSVYKLEYNGIPEVSLMIHDGKIIKNLKLNFSDIKLSLPMKYKKQYTQILSLIDKYSKDDSNKYLVKLLSDLLNNLDDKIDRDSALLQLNDYVDNNNLEGKKNIKAIISALSDENIKPAISNSLTAFESFKTDIQVLLENNVNTEQIENLLKQFKNVSSKDKRKSILQKILNIWLDMKKKWKLDDETLNSVKKSICNIMKVYKIESKACWTLFDKVPSNNDWWSTLHSILKIVWWILGILLILFIIIVAIFVVKAKKNREQNEEE